ncbi:MAG TPA: DUF5683 domain-containing protein, partial [Flavisolibacter sp.]|nr:DUF5683 domain-containing protein [Flavisolibacter sp.]
SFVVGSSQRDTAKKPLTTDSLVKAAPTLTDKERADSVRNAFSPKKATFRSLVLPGWGQAYNKKYWKIPIVYGALGVSGGVFLYNLKNYREIRFAYAAKFKASQQGATAADSVDYGNIKSYLLPFDLNSLRSFRDEFRSNIDYSVLAFLLLWGLNVVDATVDAHLKYFDVSPDLSLKFKLGPSQMAGTTGVSIVLALK